MLLVTKREGLDLSCEENGARLAGQQNGIRDPGGFHRR